MLDLKSSPLFSSLPAFLQESIRQSGINFENEQQLQDFAAQCLRVAKEYSDRT